MKNSLRGIVNIALLVVALPCVLHAQTTAEVVSRLSQMYRSAAGVDVSFALDKGSTVSMTLASNGKSYKLVTKTDEFYCNGTTVWHLIKGEKRVIVDRPGSSPGTPDAESLLDFEHNYDATLTKDKSSVLKLTLTPHANVSEMFKSVGNVSSVIFTLGYLKGNISVRSITAHGGSGDLELAKLHIKPRKTIPASTFVFIPTDDVKVVDIRD